MTLDHWVAALLVPLALWVLINGIDDLFIDIAALAGHLRHRTPAEPELDAVPPRRMAIFVACWREHRVIRKMIENNVVKLNYGPVDFFIGVYPNDTPTLLAAREAVKDYPNVHLSVCPHDGPTSKADCLNWIFQRMLLHESENAEAGLRYEMILTHDSEDLIDPDALRWINYYAQWNDMVQIPVLGLRRRHRDLTCGVYCDEFTEYQYKDMMARQALGGFIPSNGVGTGFSRRALEMLAARHSNRIFEPGCLTEDYENGFRVRKLGLKQQFIPILIRHGRAIATREYFPHEFSLAVRQRSRWVTGINLQSWEFHGVRESLEHVYWFWRDRKGLIGNIVTPLTNMVFVYGAVTWSWAEAHHAAWGLAREASSIERAGVAGLTLQALHTVLRIALCRRIYGSAFASLVPVRVLIANWINCFATCRAIWTYTSCKITGKPLRWVKTEHAYPNRAALMANRKSLREVLVGSQWISQEQLDTALAGKPEDRRLGEHLMQLGLLTEQELYTALSLQNNLPLGKPDPEVVSRAITRSLPAELSRRWRVLPFRIVAGELHVAGANVPDEAMQSEIRQFSSLELRFHLVTPSQYEELATEYLK
jgi:adsorption protein B